MPRLCELLAGALRHAFAGVPPRTPVRVVIFDERGEPTHYRVVHQFADDQAVWLTAEPVPAEALASA